MNLNMNMNMSKNKNAFNTNVPNNQQNQVNTFTEIILIAIEIRCYDKQ